MVDFFSVILQENSSGGEAVNSLCQGTAIGSGKCGRSSMIWDFNFFPFVLSTDKSDHDKLPW